MNKETKLIIKIILLNLLFGFILFAFSASKATLPEFPTAWRVGQKVHVKFTNFPELDKAEAIRYIKSKIDPLHLDIKLVFDDNLKREDGITEGIELRNMNFTTTTCAKTSTTGALDFDNKWAVKQTIRIDTTCKGGTIADSEFWYNTILHEFNHALFMPHHYYIKGRMPVPLVLTTLEMQNQLLWTYNDQWNLKRLYNRNQVVNFKRVNFKRRDLGKTAYLINGDKSVSFTIKNYSELVPYLKLKNYKVVVR
jgi:hypothetical protein